MRILQPEQLRKHVTDRLRAAYLVIGDEPLLQQEAVDLIRSAALATGAERLVYHVDARFDWSEWRLDIRSMGLFAKQRVIELRLNSVKLGADASAAILEFLDDPNLDVLIIQANEWTRTVESLPWVAAVDRLGVIVPIRTMQVDELPRWLMQRAKIVGLNLTDDAIEELVARVEGNLLAAHQELSKLALLAPGERLDAAALVDLVADHARFDVFNLFDAVLGARPERVRRVLAGLRADGTHPAELFGFLISQITILAGADELRKSGAGLHSYWPAQRVFGARIATYERALGRGWMARLREASRIDLVCKGRAAGEPWVEVERWLLRGTLPPSRALRFAA